MNYYSLFLVTTLLLWYGNTQECEPITTPVNSVQSMTEFGWDMSSMQHQKGTVDLGDRCNGSGTWYGYTDGTGVGTISYTFTQLGGDFKIKFSNCWSSANSQTVVLLNNKEIGRAGTGEGVKTATATFIKGDILKVQDQGANAVAQILSFTISACTCATKELAINSNDAMTNSGWKLGGMQHNSHSGLGAHCGSTWNGFTGGSGVGTISYTFEDQEGDFIIEYSNCWNDPNSYGAVLLNDKLLGRAGTGQGVKKVTASFVKGDVLKLQDQGQNAVVKIHSFTVTGCNTKVKDYILKGSGHCPADAHFNRDSKKHVTINSCKKYCSKKMDGYFTLWDDGDDAKCTCYHDCDTLEDFGENSVTYEVLSPEVAMNTFKLIRDKTELQEGNEDLKKQLKKCGDEKDMWANRFTVVENAEKDQLISSKAKKDYPDVTEAMVGAGVGSNPVTSSISLMEKVMYVCFGAAAFALVNKKFGGTKPEEVALLSEI